MRVNYLIIGAGLAGTVVEHFLQDKDNVLLDPSPDGYKIGESMAPEHFHHPELAAMLPEIRQLPSYVRKQGTIFVSADAIAAFPLPPSIAPRAVHAARHELEKLMHDRWQTPIVRERVAEIDIPHKRVRTDKHTYDVARQIIDCSGPAMAVARSLGDVQELWPVYSRWAYYDITGIDQSRFLDSVRASGKRYLDIGRDGGAWWDAVTKVRRSDEERTSPPAAWEHASEASRPEWFPSQMTILTEVEPGVWTWQIPMYDRKLLSFGVVSKKGKVSDEMLEDLCERTRAAHYTLRRHPRDDSHFGRVHVRDHFAQRARTPSTTDYILVADACAFADPIYSVGSALAVNKALEVAAALNEGAWDAARSERYNTEYAALLGRAVKAFEFWYTRELVERPEAAAEVQRDYLQGGAFQNGVAHHYAQSLMDSCPEESILVQGDIVGEGTGGLTLTGRVATLLHADDQRRVGDWQLAGAGWAPGGGLALRWSHPGKQPLAVLLSFDAHATRYFKRVGPISLTYMSLEDRPYPFDEPCERLMAELVERIGSASSEWTKLAAAA